MNSNIENLFKTQKAYVGYLTVGDGGVESSFNVAKALISGGVNILELGMPFSDPVADGPVIQRAATRALQAHITLADVLQLAKRLRAEFPSIPLILFSYFNPLLVTDPRRWLPEAKAAGIDGILVVDLPFEEGGEFYDLCAEYDLAPISIITPATSVTRLQMIAQKARGFLYYACRKGTTGIQAELPDDFIAKMTVIKQYSPLPVVAGFGISNAATVKTVLQYADGFVVGSLFVQAVEEQKSTQEITQLARSLCY